MLPARFGTKGQHPGVAEGNSAICRSNPHWRYLAFCEPSKSKSCDESQHSIGSAAIDRRFERRNYICF